MHKAPIFWLPLLCSVCWGYIESTTPRLLDDRFSVGITPLGLTSQWGSWDGPSWYTLFTPAQSLSRWFKLYPDSFCKMRGVHTPEGQIQLGCWVPPSSTGEAPRKMPGFLVFFTRMCFLARDMGWAGFSVTAAANPSPAHRVLHSNRDFNPGPLSSSKIIF